MVSMNPWNCLSWPSLLACLLLCVAAPCRADDTDTWFKGPADLRNQQPYQALFFQFSPQTPDVLAPHAMRHALALDGASILLIPAVHKGEARVTEDTEVQKLTYTERRGLGHGLELSAALPLFWRNGGFLDKLTNAYHQAVGLNKPTVDVVVGRLTLPSYRSILRDIRPDGTTAVDAHPAFGLGDLTLTLKKELLAGRSTAFSLRAGVKLPTGAPGQYLGSGAADFGLMLDGKRILTRQFGVYLNIGMVWNGKATHLDNTRARVAQYILTFENRATNRTSWTLQFEGGETVYKTGNAFADSPPRTLTLAYRRLIRPETLMTLAFTENGDIHGYHDPFINNIGPDFVVSAHVEWRR